MTRTLLVATALLCFGLVSMDAEAQSRRMGGGRNLGKQRPAPTMQEAAKAPAAAPAAPAQQAAPAKPGTAPGATPAAPAKPTFMQRWGGLLAGLGIGALLASLFGAQLGPIIGMLLMALLAFVVIAFLFRLFSRKSAPPAYAGAGTPPAGGIGNNPFTGTSPAPAEGGAPAFRGIGAALPASSTAPDAPSREVMARNIQEAAIPTAEIAPFLRVAKTSFIRLQAAHDARDLNDIRDYTTPELYAEIAMQVQERGDEPQRTEVVNIDAQLLEAVVEGDDAVAAVRFSGLIRENNAPNPEPFDELWHVRKSLKQRNAPWLIAGIQQME